MNRRQEAAQLTPGRVIRVFGMRRSGNHAIVNWILRNGPDGGAVFLNNCHPRKDPMQHHNGIDVFLDGAPLEFPAGMRTQARLDKAGEKPLVLISYEDVMPPKLPRDMPPVWPNPVPDETIVIVRSFLNWSASLLRKIMKNEDFGPVARMRIMGIAFKTYTIALEHVRNAPETGVMPVCYDDWFASADARSRLAEALNLPLRDTSLGKTQHFGGGSSFQGKASPPEDLETDRRADLMADEPEYQMLLWTAARDTGFMALIREHFPIDAHRLEQLAETARIEARLPVGEIA